MGQVIGMRPTPPVDPIKCKGYECGGSTFFVYWDGHIICASCGLKPEYLGPLIDMEEWAGPLLDDDGNPKDLDEEENSIVFEADPSLLDKLQ